MKRRGFLQSLLGLAAASVAPAALAQTEKTYVARAGDFLKPTSPEINSGKWLAETYHADGNYLAYAFDETSGFQQIGTYVGNGADVATFHHSLGFKPSMVMMKRTDAPSDWIIQECPSHSK